MTTFDNYRVLTPAGYRVHVGNDYATFMLLDVFDVATPADALEQAKRVRYYVLRENGKEWLAIADRSACTVQVEEFACPDKWWEDEDNDLSTLEFSCDEDDAL